jgi:ParB family transcriptional regulator, chromosome partitioning protein
VGWSQALCLGASQGIYDLRGDDDGSGKQRDLIAKRSERARWLDAKAQVKADAWAVEPDPVVGFALFRAAGPEAKAQAAALVAGHMLMATTSSFNDGRTPRMVRELANHIEAEPGFGRWRDGVGMDEAFFATFSHKARLGLLQSWGLADRSKGMKAGETAAFCARVANCDEADARLLNIHPDDLAECVNWMPSFLETAPVEAMSAPQDAAGDDDDNGDFEDADEEDEED